MEKRALVATLCCLSTAQTATANKTYDLTFTESQTPSELSGTTPQKEFLLEGYPVGRN